MVDEEKKEEVKEEVKSDEQILFPEAKVKIMVDGKEEELVLRPWTFGVLVDINSPLSDIFEAMEKRGVKLDEQEIGFIMIKNIYFSVVPQVLTLLKVMLKKDDEYVRNLDVNSVMKLLYVVWEQNKDNLKNVLTAFVPRNK